MAYMKDSTGRRLDDIAVADAPQNRLAILGDSLGDNQESITGTYPNNGYVTAVAGSYAFAHIACAMLSGRLRVVANPSATGTRSDVWVSGGQIDAVLAASPGWVVVTAPTNDRKQDIPLATTQGHITTIVTALRNAGVRVVLMGLGPEAAGGSGAALTQGRIDFTVGYAQWIRQLAATQPGVYACDPFPALSDGAGAGLWVDTTTNRWTPDNLHPFNWSAFRMGRLLADLLEPLVPYVDNRPIASIDNRTASVTNRNLLSSSGSAGTTGGNGSSKGGTGTVKTSFSVTSSDGANFGGAVASSIVTATDQNPVAWQQHALTGAFSRLRVQQNAITAGYTAGTTKIRPEVEVDIDAGAAINRLTVSAQIIIPGGFIESQWAYIYAGAASAADWPDENRFTKDYRGRYPVLVGPDIVIPAAATSVGWYLDITGMGTVRWRYPALRVVS